jgi:hypothetical protein
MKYLETKFIRKNLTTIFIVLGILIIVYYLFSSYRFAYKTPFGYIENLDNCTTVDCSKIKTDTGTTLKDDSGCIAGVPDCVPGSRCRICTASSTNPTCTSSSCAQDGVDPWVTGKHMGCCSDSKEFLNNWDSNNPTNYFYKCCKPSGLPPVDKCAGVDCGDHGGCQNGQCICKDNYTGSKCNVPPTTDPCAGVDCGDHGGCQNGQCICKDNYTGSKCNVPPTTDPCAGVDCGDHGGCQNGQCICKDNYTGSKCNVPPTTDPCAGITCPSGQVCQNGVCVSGGGNTPDIKNQPDDSLQIINNTSENPLHIFIGTINYPWTKLGGSGSIYPAIPWGEKGKPEIIAWNPVGAIKLSEAIVPKNGYVILKIPQDIQPPIAVRVVPLKLRNNDNTPLTSTKIALSKVLKQSPILLEGGRDVVADSSAVDGINFKMKYELTSDDNTIKVMEIHKNPCEGLDQKYQMEVGCWSPVKIDCGLSPTCDCLGNQKCKFNDCSQKIFNIPDNLKQYIGNYDSGNPHPIVKTFVENSTNIKEGTMQRKFCDAVHYNSGDFEAYCYDYNDLHASVNLRKPNKMKVTYMDL